MNLSTHSHELTVTEQSDWIVHHLFLLIVAASNISVTLHRGQIHLENTRLWEPSRLRKYKIISPRHRANAGVVLTDTFGLLSLCSWHQTKSSEKLPDLSFLIPCTGKKKKLFFVLSTNSHLFVKQEQIWKRTPVKSSETVVTQRRSHRYLVERLGVCSKLWVTAAHFVRECVKDNVSLHRNGY